jgi:hypothetical protein
LHCNSWCSLVGRRSYRGISWRILLASRILRGWVLLLLTWLLLIGAWVLLLAWLLIEALVLWGILWLAVSGVVLRDWLVLRLTLH